MRRTQIYLTAEQHQHASRAAAETGQTLSDIVRIALDEYLLRRRRQRKEFLGALQSAAGIWRSRTDINDPIEIRRAGQRRDT